MLFRNALPIAIKTRKNHAKFGCPILLWLRRPFTGTIYAIENEAPGGRPQPALVHRAGWSPGECKERTSAASDENSDPSEDHCGGPFAASEL